MTYDCRGGRARKWFATGGGRAARTFYATMLREGKNPKVVKGDDEPDLFRPVSDGTGPA